jgi:hypothetical protein
MFDWLMRLIDGKEGGDVEGGTIVGSVRLYKNVHTLIKEELPKLKFIRDDGEILGIDIATWLLKVMSMSDADMMDKHLGKGDTVRDRIIQDIVYIYDNKGRQGFNTKSDLTELSKFGKLPNGGIARGALPYKIEKHLAVITSSRLNQLATPRTINNPVPTQPDRPLESPRVREVTNAARERNLAKRGIVPKPGTSATQQDQIFTLPATIPKKKPASQPVQQPDLPIEINTVDPIVDTSLPEPLPVGPLAPTDNNRDYLSSALVYTYINPPDDTKFKETSQPDVTTDDNVTKEEEEPKYTDQLNNILDVELNAAKKSTDQPPKYDPYTDPDRIIWADEPWDPTIPNSHEPPSGPTNIVAVVHKKKDTQRKKQRDLDDSRGNGPQRRENRNKHDHRSLQPRNIVQEDTGPSIDINYMKHKPPRTSDVNRKEDKLLVIDQDLPAQYEVGPLVNPKPRRTSNTKNKKDRQRDIADVIRESDKQPVQPPQVPVTNTQSPQVPVTNTQSPQVPVTNIQPSQKIDRLSTYDTVKNSLEVNQFIIKVKVSYPEYATNLIRFGTIYAKNDLFSYLGEYIINYCVVLCPISNFMEAIKILVNFAEIQNEGNKKITFDNLIRNTYQYSKFLDTSHRTFANAKFDAAVRHYINIIRNNKKRVKDSINELWSDENLREYNKLTPPDVFLTLLNAEKPIKRHIIRILDFVRDENGIIQNPSKDGYNKDVPIGSAKDLIIFLDNLYNSGHYSFEEIDRIRKFQEIYANTFYGSVGRYIVNQWYERKYSDDRCVQMMTTFNRVKKNIIEDIDLYFGDDHVVWPSTSGYGGKLDQDTITKLHSCVSLADNTLIDKSTDIIRIFGTIHKRTQQGVNVSMKYEFTKDIKTYKDEEGKDYEYTDKVYKTLDDGFADEMYEIPKPKQYNTGKTSKPKSKQYPYIKNIKELTEFIDYLNKQYYPSSSNNLDSFKSKFAEHERTGHLGEFIANVCISLSPKNDDGSTDFWDAKYVFENFAGINNSGESENTLLELRGNTLQYNEFSDADHTKFKDRKFDNKFRRYIEYVFQHNIDVNYTISQLWNTRGNYRHILSLTLVDLVDLQKIKNRDNIPNDNPKVLRPIHSIQELNDLLNMLENIETEHYKGYLSVLESFINKFDIKCSSILIEGIINKCVDMGITDEQYRDVLNIFSNVDAYKIRNVQIKTMYAGLLDKTANEFIYKAVKLALTNGHGAIHKINDIFTELDRYLDEKYVPERERNNNQSTKQEVKQDIIPHPIKGRRRNRGRKHKPSK